MHACHRLPARDRHGPPLRRAGGCPPGRAAGGGGVIKIFVPGALKNPLNGSFSRAHWSARNKWANEWKNATRLTLLRNAQSFRDELGSKLSCHIPKRIT